jgi:hypothetical protein
MPLLQRVWPDCLLKGGNGLLKLPLWNRIFRDDTDDLLQNLLHQAPSPQARTRPPVSLPSRYGVGTIGASARRTGGQCPRVPAV